MPKPGDKWAVKPDKTDARIPVRPPATPDPLDGLDVEFSFAGNFVPPSPVDIPPPRFTGTLMSSRGDEDGEAFVRLVTNQALEDANGREVYQVDLDQPSVDSLRQDRESGKWLLRLPDLYRPVR